ncbi:MAG: hypothetical protein WAN38_09670 [Terriglobales bacterium]|jgi:hypothetical protein
MRRIQFIEIHEQAWFPPSIRDQITEALQFGFHLLNAYGPVAPLLQRAFDATRCRSVVDLCSGGGGPWLDLSRRLTSSAVAGVQPGLRIWLTDKYPNLGAFQKVVADSENQFAYYPSSVDAMKVPRELRGFRTMFTSFHHFSPEKARAILQDAVTAGEGIGIFELTRRSPSTIALMFAWVLLLLACTPWIRPFRWSRLLWTCVVPIIPLVLLFDGVVSCLRTYRPEELRVFIAGLAASGYQWDVGEQSTGRVPITYLIGYSRDSRELVPEPY